LRLLTGKIKVKSPAFLGRNPARLVPDIILSSCPTPDGGAKLKPAQSGKEPHRATSYLDLSVCSVKIHRTSAIDVVAIKLIAQTPE
jgi:hypothetical protein